MSKKKPKTNSELDFSSNTTPSIDDPLVEWSAIIAHILIGLNPYLDISTVHIMVMDGIAKGIDEDQAQKLGQSISKKARISINKDAYGGVH